MRPRTLLHTAVILLLSSTLLFGQTAHPDFQDGKVMFQLKRGTAFLAANNAHVVMLDKVDFLKEISSKYGITKVVQKHPAITDEDLRLTYEIEFTNWTAADNLVREVQKQSSILYVEKKVLHHLFFTPNDPKYTSSASYHLFKIKAAAAWDISKGSSSIVVAVTDNAMYTSHADLTNKFTTNGYDVADSDGDVNPPALNSDWDHGTHTSGLVGAETNNGTGMASIGFNTMVMPVKIGRNSDGALIAGFDGVIYAADYAAKVISMSWGSTQTSTYGQTVMNYAYNKGCVLVAAAGNDGVGTMNYPAAYTNVIAVASSTSSDKISSFSNYGTWIDVTSPGSSINSTTASDNPFGGGKYQYMDGTSMATPIVAGLCGLMLSVNPNLTPAQIETCLKQNCDNIDALNSSYIGYMGSGRINAQKALQCVQATVNSLDAGVKTFVSPFNSNICANTITPVIEINNYGSTALTQVTINYNIDGGTNSTYTWFGSLAASSSTNVTLPPISVPPGIHTVNAYTSDPNNTSDGNSTNDASSTVVQVLEPLPLPLNEGFEGSFPPTGWWIYNPDTAVTWALTTSVGNSSSNSVMMNNFNYNNSGGKADALVFPTLDLTTASDLTFDVAYVAYDAQYADTLEVWISTDCGNSYTSIWKKYGSNLATKTPNYQTSQFTPSSTQWRNETIDLSPYTFSNSAILLFWSISGWGNNVFIDNVNVNALSTTGIKSVTDNGNVKIYPNPTSDVLNINFSDNTFEGSTVNIYNMLGEFVTGLTGSSLNQLNKVDLGSYTKGVYFIEISSNNTKQIQKVVLR